MKKLRLRNTVPPYTLRCGAVFSIEAEGTYPVPFIWNIVSTVDATADIVNHTGKPIKMKLYFDDILQEETDYFGDPAYQLALDTFNVNNMKPQEDIENILTGSLVINTPVGISKISVKVYCPLLESGFTLTINCT